MSDAYLNDPRLDDREFDLTLSPREGLRLASALLNYKAETMKKVGSEDPADVMEVDYFCSDRYYELLGSMFGGDADGGRAVEEHFLNRVLNQ